MNFDDLPAKLKRQALAASGSPRKARTTQRTGMRGPIPTVCICGERYPSGAAWSRHSAVSGHRHTRSVGPLADGSDA